jgi:hypothetical protein
MKRARVLWATALTVTAMWSAADLRAQLPMAQSTVFEMTGFIQSATLDSATDPFSGGTLTMNNHVVVIPKNTIFQMPATSLTWSELFKQAPAPWGPTQTGLALSDTPKPDYTFEVAVQGNRVGDTYIAGLVFISNLSLQAHQGFISSINYATGELMVGNTRVRLNDPNILAGTANADGRYGRAWSHDVRFRVDQDNPTVKSETGFPMCIPRSDPATTADPLCPQYNRPVNGTPSPAAGIVPVNGTGGSLFQSVFVMPAPTTTTAGAPVPGSVNPDPFLMAPFEVGDYVTVRGPIVTDAAGKFISAYAVDANVGIFTAPGTRPAYVSIDVILMGTGPLNDVTLAQEGAKRTRVEGFTTDISTVVKVSAVDVNACTGEALDRYPEWSYQAVDPGPPNGAVAGRWRFRPGAPLFDLKGFPFLPPTREVHAISITGTVPTTNGLSAGEYTAPNFQFILPENLGIGSPKIPGNFENMPFLVNGSGPRGGAYVGQLSPWPGGSVAPRAGCAVVGLDQTVTSGATVSLDGSQSLAANLPNKGASYAWSQQSGPSVVLTNANTVTATFIAPTLAVGAATQTLTFKLTATPNNGSPAVDSRVVSVAVTAPADTVKPNVGTPTAVQGTSTALRRGTLTTLSTTATDNVGVTSVTFLYSYVQNGTKNGTVIATRSGTTNTWNATFTPASTVPSGTSYTFTALASDAAGNQTTSTALVKTIQ